MINFKHSIYLLAASSILAGCGEVEEPDLSRPDIVYQAPLTPEQDVATSAYWQRYLNSRALSSSSRDVADITADKDVLPNFSYAGYAFGNLAIPTKDMAIGYGNSVPEFDPVLNYQIFDVTNSNYDGGAIADDGNSDKAAVVAAVKAAESFVANGGIGAIIYFPRGTFLLNELSDMDALGLDHENWTPEQRTANKNLQSIVIKKSNIIVRGSGSGTNGTVLYMSEHLEPENTANMWTTPKLFIVGSTVDPKTKLATVTEPVIRETTKTVTVNSTAELSIGQWVKLASVDTRLASIEQAVAPYEVHANWTQLSAGLKRQQNHQIAAIDGNEVTFSSIIHSNIEASDTAGAAAWELQTYQPVTNVGFEDLAFEGAWSKETFVHHEDYIGDSGWSALIMRRVANSWIKNVRFTSINDALSIANSTAVTAQDIIVDGVKGHLTISISGGSSNVLAINVSNPAGTWHGVGFSHLAAGNVILNADYAQDSSPNIHATMPRINLFDKLSGGWRNTQWGGSQAAVPNHLKYLVFWNPENISEPQTKTWEFMRSDTLKYSRIITPYVIGLNGTPITIAKQQTYVDAVGDSNFLGDESQAFEESMGQAVKPYSLYEAQLKQRLGVLPQWLIEATDKVKYIRFTALEGDNGDDDARAVVQILDQYGNAINLDGGWEANFAKFPTQVVINLGDYYQPTVLRYTRYGNDNSNVSSYQIHVSSDNINWQAIETNGSLDKTQSVTEMSLQ